MSLGKRLQSLMDRKKINQVDAAKGIGLDRSRFNLLLNDKVGTPRRETLLKIGSFFGCEIEWLATGKGPMFRESTGRGDQNLVGNGSIMAGGDIKGSLNGTQPASDKSTIDLDNDEKELILKLRDVGGKRTLRKFINELDRIKKIIDEEI